MIVFQPSISPPKSYSSKAERHSVSCICWRLFSSSGHETDHDHLWRAQDQIAKSPVATFFLRHPVTIYQPTFAGYLNSFSASRYNHNGHRESTYVMVNRSNTLPNAYSQLVEYKDSSCRLLRHSKTSALVHSLNGNSLLPRVHWPFGTQSVILDNVTNLSLLFIRNVVRIFKHLFSPFTKTLDFLPCYFLVDCHHSNTNLFYIRISL